MLNFKNVDKVFVTSDTHLKHNKDFVWKARGYNSVKEHDDGIIDTINATVDVDDTLVHLGDFCLNASVQDFEELISRINCQNIYMLWGNHPNPHFKEIYKPLVQSFLGEHYTYDSEIYPLRYRNVVYIGNYCEVSFGKQFAVLSHYPISIWNYSGQGAWMLCGHSHNSFPQTRAESTAGKILDVGWDGHKAPWSVTELSDVMKKKQFVGIDHHF